MARLARKIWWKGSTLLRGLYYSYFPDKQLIRRMEENPGTLSIELTNVCNANCIFCGYQYQRRPRQIMADSIFEKAIHSYVEVGGGDLYLDTLVGDPLLDPDVISRVRYARSFSEIRRIETITNGVNLHNIGARNLLTSGLNKISVSTAGFDPMMYKRIFRNAHFEQMKANLLELLRVNCDLGNPVKITVGLRVDRPMAEVIDAPDFREVVDRADEVDANDYFDSWSGRIKPEDLPGQMKLRPNVLLFLKRRVPCLQLWLGIGVLVDGIITACSCRDLNADSDFVLGHISEKTLREAYQSGSLKKIREEWFEEGKTPGLCKDCGKYNPYTYSMLPEVKRELFG
jgi:MoaA/NifB/PqqE/SkfB family radical SAM enzyme